MNKKEKAKEKAKGAAHLAKKGYNKLKGESLLTRTKRKVKDNI